MRRCSRALHYLGTFPERFFWRLIPVITGCMSPRLAFGRHEISIRAAAAYLGQANRRTCNPLEAKIATPITTVTIVQSDQAEQKDGDGVPSLQQWDDIGAQDGWNGAIDALVSCLSCLPNSCGHRRVCSPVRARRRTSTSVERYLVISDCDTALCNFRSELQDWLPFFPLVKSKLTVQPQHAFSRPPSAAGHQGWH